MDDGNTFFRILVFLVCFGLWHALSVVKVGVVGRVEHVRKVPEKDLDKVRDNGTGNAIAGSNQPLTDKDYDFYYSDDAEDDHELSEDEIDAVFRKTEEKRRIHEKILMEEKEREERLQKEIRNENEESLGAFIKNSHLSLDMPMGEFAKDLENITRAEHGPAYKIHVNKKMLKQIPKGMNLRKFVDYVQGEEEQIDNELKRKEMKRKKNQNSEEDDDLLLYDEPDIPIKQKDTKVREFVLMDIYENITEENSGKVDFQVKDFLHDKSLNETAILKEKGLYGRDKEFNETIALRLDNS